MFYDAWQEHCDYEANARYDYMWEAYGAEAAAMNAMEAECDRLEAEEWMADMEAAFGPYVASDVASSFDDMPF